jgi:hypothetical protein
MQRIAENERGPKGSRPLVKSAQSGKTLPAARLFSDIDFCSEFSRTRFLSTAITFKPSSAKGSAFLPNPHGASNIGAPSDDANRSRKRIRVLDGADGGCKFRWDNAPRPAAVEEVGTTSLWRRCPSSFTDVVRFLRLAFLEQRCPFRTCTHHL